MEINEEIQKAAYEANYSLIKHYSLMLFKCRVYLISITLVVWAYLLGLKPDSPKFSVEICSETISGKAAIAYFFSFVIIMFSIMENAYQKRYYNVIYSGNCIESKYKTTGFFSLYMGSFNLPFLVFNMIMIVGFFAMFIVLCFKNNVNVVFTIILMIVWSGAFYYFFYRSMEDVIKVKREIHDNIEHNNFTLEE